MGCRSFTIYIVTFTSLQDPLRLDCTALSCAPSMEKTEDRKFASRITRISNTIDRFSYFPNFTVLFVTLLVFFFFIFSQVNKEPNMAMSDFRRNKLVYVFKAFFGLFTFPKIRFQLMMLSSFLPNFPSNRCG